MLLLIWKDVKNIISDKRILAVILMMPIILMSILGFSLREVFSDEGSGVQHFEIAIVKEYDHDSEITRYQELLDDMNIENIEAMPDPEEIFFNDFLGDTQLQQMMSYTIVDRAQGEKLLVEDKISALIVLPKDFIFNTMMNFTFSRNKVSLEVLKNSDSQTAAGIVEQILEQFSNIMNRVVVRRMTLLPYLVNADKPADIPMEELLFPSKEPELTLTVKEVSGKESWNSFQYYAVAMMAMFTLYAAGFGGRALIEEKDKFTLQRLKVAGKNLELTVLSNFCRVAIIVILQSIIMIAYSLLVLGVDFGNLSNMVLPVLANAVSISTLGMLISVITLASGSYAFANVFEYGIVNLMALVGGSFIPVQILPKVLQTAHLYSISGIALDLFLNAIAGEPLSAHGPLLINLLVMDLLFAGCAWIILMVKKRKGGVLV
jgi:ABC-2 type transport system permease protein